MLPVGVTTKLLVLFVNNGVLKGRANLPFFSLFFMGQNMILTIIVFLIGLSTANAAIAGFSGKGD
jgi:hypothetical protein